MEGGEVVKIIKRSEGDAELILLLRMVCVWGVHDILISPLKLISQPPSWQLLHSPLMISNFLYLSLSTLHSSFFYEERTDTIIFAN